MTTCGCEKMDRIIDVDCDYENGRFYMRKLPGCLPRLFTIRFVAPADYSTGENIVVDKQEYPVLTSQMVSAETGIFKTGAVMLCEIDRDRDLAFIRTGGTSCACEDVEFQSSDLVYYIDPNGDDSPNNTGGVDSPFRTLAGAGRAAWENIVMNPLGRLVFSFNPGTYDLSSADHVMMTRATHPLGILFKGTDSDNKPLIRADHFNSNHGHRELQGLNLHCLSTTNDHALTAYDNASIILTDSEVVINRSNGYVFGNHAGGYLRVFGTLKVNGNGHTPLSVFTCNQATLWANTAAITLENFASVEYATVTNDSGQMFFHKSTFSGSITGRRYHVYHNGVVNTANAGPNFIPGTIAGTTATGGHYN